MSGSDGLTFLRHVKSWFLAGVLFAIVVIVLSFQSISITDEISQIILTISTFFTAFSLLLLVISNMVFAKAHEFGVLVNKNLMKDYRTGILITFLLSTLVVASIIFTAYRHEYMACVVVGALSVVIAMSIILALGLYQITKSYTEVV
ncbi:MAG: hypothetical protein QW820_06720 [Sulfolobales archaeon]